MSSHCLTLLSNFQLHPNCWTQHTVKPHYQPLLLRRFSYARPCAIPETAAHQAPPSLGVSYQKDIEMEAIAGEQSFRLIVITQMGKEIKGI